MAREEVNRRNCHDDDGEDGADDGANDDGGDGKVHDEDNALN